MLKYFFETSIKSIKNINFQLDKDVPNSAIIGLLFSKFIELIRNCFSLLFIRQRNILFIGRGVKIDCVKKVKIGSFSQIGDYVYLNGLGKKGLVIGTRCNIGAFSRFVVSSNFQNLGELIEIGNNVAIGAYSSIGGSGGVTIRDNTIIGQYLSCHPENHLFSNPDKFIREQGTERKPIIIGDNCWIGAKVTILSGVTIGKNVVVGAASLVNKNVPDNCIVAGVPAKIIRYYRSS